MITKFGESMPPISYFLTYDVSSVRQHLVIRCYCDMGRENKSKNTEACKLLNIYAYSIAVTK